VRSQDVIGEIISQTSFTVSIGTPEGERILGNYYSQFSEIGDDKTTRAAINMTELLTGEAHL
jgi:hypothetical protein